MTEVTYRMVTESDLAALSPLNSAKFVQRTYQLHLTSAVRFAVAVVDDQIVASEVLDLAGGDWCPEIRNLVVAFSARRQGYGLGLTAYLEGVARDAGFTEVFVGGPVDNAAATALFISQDYVATGEQRSHGYSWTDESGTTHTATQVDVMWRKSLALR